MLKYATKDPFSSLLPPVKAIAREAGRRIMEIYAEIAADPALAEVQIKADNSPVTRADKLSSAHIETALQTLTPGIVIVSEENEEVPPADGLYWVVDPLDGTKEFLQRTGGFAVNIALIENGAPVLGIVYSPAFDTLYSSVAAHDATRQTGGEKAPEEILRTRPTPQKGELTALFNEKHADPALYTVSREAFVSRGLCLPATPDIRPSLPRNLQVAAGMADVNIVTGKDASLEAGGGFIWDVAADFLILGNAGGGAYALKDGRRLHSFDQGRNRIPSYIALGDRTLAGLVFQK